VVNSSLESAIRNGFNLKLLGNAARVKSQTEQNPDAVIVSQ
jgi:hypothetical protein